MFAQCNISFKFPKQLCIGNVFSKQTAILRRKYATGLRTAAGPVEATALGNILIQLVALGMLPSIDAGRRLIAKTERVTEYLPGDTAAWDAAHVRYEDLLRRGGKTEK